MDVNSGRLTLALVLGMLVVAWFPTSTARAGGVVVADCRDRSRSKLGKRVVAELRKALVAKGVSLRDYRKYTQRAKRNKLVRQSSKPAGIAKLSKALSLDGVVTCQARRVGKSRFRISLALHGADGKVRMERSYLNRKPLLARSVIAKLAGEMAAALGVAPLEPTPEPDDLALVPLAPLVPVEPQPEVAEADGAITPEAEAKPKVATLVAKPVETKAPDPAPDPVSPLDDVPAPRPTPVDMLAAMTATKPAAEPEVAVSAAPPADDRRSDGVVPQVWVTGGACLHLRAGLSPRYSTSAFPGMRVEARAFLGAGVDLPFLKDLGLDGFYDRGFGLTYSSALRPEKLDAQEQHWAAGLAYRFDIEALAGGQIPTGPTLLLRLGYGSSENVVDQVYPDVLSAAYTYLYGSLAIHLWLVRSLLSAELTAGYLPSVWPSESLSGEGSGITFSAAVNLEMVAGLTASLGYEQIQFVIDEDELGKTSDRYEVWFLRLGWAYR